MGQVGRKESVNMGLACDSCNETDMTKADAPMSFIQSSEVSDEAANNSRWLRWTLDRKPN